MTFAVMTAAQSVRLRLTIVLFTSRNVVVASNVSGTPTPNSRFVCQLCQRLSQLGTFTGVDGANPALISILFITIIPADTQLLGNFEYRIPDFRSCFISRFC